MTIRVREATRTDLPILLEFEQGIVTYERAFDATIKPDPVSYYDLGEHIDSADALVAVAELNGELIGSGFVRKRKSRHYTLPEYHAYVGFLFTLPEHRGKGVNKLVLEVLFNWARDNDLSNIRLTVYPENDSAVRAYTKAGFKPDLLEMRLTLDDLGAR